MSITNKEELKVLKSINFLQFNFILISENQ